MTKEDFVNRINNIGIILEDFGAYLGILSKKQYSIGVFCDNGEWVVYSVDERNNVFESFRGDEDTAFEKFYRKLFVRIDEQNYINESVTKDIIKLTQRDLFDFLKRKYSMEEWELKETWDYLLQDFKTLNEMKYYVKTSSFVPEKDAYCVEGYTAKKIFDETYLDELGAHNYLIYLKRNPKKALADLKAGLPRK